MHKSQLAMHERCPRQYMYRYVDNVLLPPASAMLIGTGVHASAALDLTAKRDTGKLLPVDVVTDAAAAKLESEWQKGVALDEDEKLRGDKQARGNAIDAAVALSALHHKELAPSLTPKHIERPFTVELRDFPTDLSGTLDLQEQSGELRDLKTRSASPPKGLADASMDLSFYGLAAQALDGKAPTKLALDVLVKNKTPRLVTQETRRGPAAYKALLQRIALVAQAISSGSFPPCSAESWCCSPKWCGYWNRCPFGAAARVQG